MAEGMARQAYPIGAVIAEFEAIHQAMVRERDGWARELARLAPAPAPSAREIAQEILAEAGAERARARSRLGRTERRVKAGRAKRATLLRWIRNPARMIWAAHVELNALAAARQDARLADVRFGVRRDWLRSEAGRSYLAARLDPAKQAVEEARRSARTLERKIKRADKRIDNAARTRTKLMVARDLGEASLVAPSKMSLGAGQALREVDRRVVDAIARHPAAAQQQSLDRVMALVRGKLPGLGPDR